jgi:hypothetical protein
MNKKLLVLNLNLINLNLIRNGFKGCPHYATQAFGHAAFNALPGEACLRRAAGCLQFLKYVRGFLKL